MENLKTISKTCQGEGAPGAAQRRQELSIDGKNIIFMFIIEYSRSIGEGNICFFPFQVYSGGEAYCVLETYCAIYIYKCIDTVYKCRFSL